MIQAYRIILPVLFCCFLFSAAYSQESALAGFTALRSAGPVPADFERSVARSVAETGNKKSRAKSADRKKGHEKFRIAAGYGINEMFLSGRVLFGDPIGEYVNRVADSLLRAFPELRSEMRFYVSKSTVANAYSTDQGVVFINIGLIARLQNEAQLAYVIAHEVVHYVHKHNITIFTEKEKAAGRARKDSDYRNLSVFEKLLAINYRSKEIETLADAEGLRTFLARSNYDLQSAQGVLDVLLYSSFPFTNKPFNLAALENDHMIIPDYYLIDEVEEFRVDEDEADSMSTHPNVQKRRKAIGELIDSIGTAGSMEFIHPADEFTTIKNLARFEVVRQLLINHRMAEALFCTSALLEEFPENFYLKKCYAASLYGLSTYKSRGHMGEKIQNYRDVKGEMRQVNFMVSKMNRRDVNILALNYAWRLQKEHPEDGYLNEIVRALFTDLVRENSVKKEFFHTKSLEELREELTQEPAEDSVAAGTRMRKKRTRHSKIDTAFTKFAFVDLMADAQFHDDFERCLKQKDSVEKAATVYRHQASPQQNRPSKKGSVKVHSVLMADPFSLKVDTRKHDNIMYAESELNHARIKELITLNAKKAGLNMAFADAGNISESAADGFNEMAFVKEYMEERFNQSDNSIGVSFCKENIYPMMMRFDTDYLGWTAIISIQKKKNILGLSLLSIIPYLWPYTIYEFSTPKVHTYYYHILFDVATGETRIAKVSRVRSKIRKDQLNAHIYDFMYSIRRTAK